MDTHCSLSAGIKHFPEFPTPSGFIGLSAAPEKSHKQFRASTRHHQSQEQLLAPNQWPHWAPHLLKDMTQRTDCSAPYPFHSTLKPQEILNFIKMTDKMLTYPKILSNSEAKTCKSDWFLLRGLWTLQCSPWPKPLNPVRARKIPQTTAQLTLRYLMLKNQLCLPGQPAPNLSAPEGGVSQDLLLKSKLLVQRVLPQSSKYFFPKSRVKYWRVK